jgi:hypothetical protein
MKGKNLFSLVSTGKRPVVKITDFLWDESFGSKGMMAEVVSATAPDSDGCMSFKFDYSKFKDTNLPLQSHDWFIGRDGKTGTAFEAGVMDEKEFSEEVVFGEDDDVSVEVVETGLLGEYVKSGAVELGVTYTAWLENRCLSLSQTLLELMERTEKDEDSRS